MCRSVSPLPNVTPFRNLVPLSAITSAFAPGGLVMAIIGK